MLNKILINGRGGSGKDEIADYLVEKYGFTKLSFAYGIYKVAYLLGMKKKNRWLLQKIGETARFFWEDIWVWITYRKADQLIKEGKKVVISDCRRANEYEWGRERNYTPIRVSAELETRLHRIYLRDGIYPNPELLERPTETGADKFPYIEIDNNCSKEELYKQIDKLIQ